jgi:peptide chain release factor 1
MVHKSQHRNREEAIRLLRARLVQVEQEMADASRTRDRRAQIATGDRSFRVRTYNFPQNRVTDHRLEGERSFNLERVVEGDLDGIIDRLVEEAAGAGATGA